VMLENSTGPAVSHDHPPHEKSRARGGIDCISGQNLTPA
jgi:hypothetical protein